MSTRVEWKIFVPSIMCHMCISVYHFTFIDGNKYITKDQKLIRSKHQRSVNGQRYNHTPLLSWEVCSLIYASICSAFVFKVVLCQRRFKLHKLQQQKVKTWRREEIFFGNCAPRLLLYSPNISIALCAALFYTHVPVLLNGTVKYEHMINTNTYAGDGSN